MSLIVIAPATIHMSETERAWQVLQLEISDDPLANLEPHSFKDRQLNGIALAQPNSALSRCGPLQLLSCTVRRRDGESSGANTTARISLVEAFGSQRMRTERKEIP